MVPAGADFQAKRLRGLRKENLTGMGPVRRRTLEEHQEYRSCKEMKLRADRGPPSINVYCLGAEAAFSAAEFVALGEPVLIARIRTGLGVVSYWLSLRASLDQSL